jgi:SAM-dependent methyltransferase
MESEIYKDGTYLNNHPDWHEEDSAWKAGKILSAIRRNALAPRHIAEIGCGAGEILSQLYLNFPEDTHFTGYEISPQAYQLALSRTKDRLAFLQGGLDQIGPGKFDLILVIDVIEHVEDCFGFLRKLREKRATVLFHIPLDVNVKNLVGKRFLAHRKISGHLHYFTRETALALLQDTGFKVVDSFYSNSSLEAIRRSGKIKVSRLFTNIIHPFSAELSTVLFGNSLLVVAL